MKLTIEATDKNEIEAWGKNTIDTSIPAEAAKLKAALTKNRFKRN